MIGRRGFFSRLAGLTVAGAAVSLPESPQSAPTATLADTRPVLVTLLSGERYVSARSVPCEVRGDGLYPTEAITFPCEHDVLITGAFVYIPWLALKTTLPMDALGATLRAGDTLTLQPSAGRLISITTS